MKIENIFVQYFFRLCNYVAPMYSFMHSCWVHNLLRADNPHFNGIYLM
jgi:hypothetical protein